jgi:VWFA-related protein
VDVKQDILRFEEARGLASPRETKRRGASSVDGVLHLTFLLLLAVQQLPAFRTEVRVVRVDAEVRLGTRAVEGLTPQDFRITDEGKAQEIIHFGYDDEALDLILLFDTSGSMRPSIQQVAAVTRIALGELRAGDRVAVMAFDRDTDLVADFTTDHASVEATIRDVVLQRPPVGFTRLQGATADAARHFATQPRSDRRRAVLVVNGNMGSSNDEGAAPGLWNADSVVSAIVVPGMAAMRRQRILFPPAWFGFGKIDGVVNKTGGDLIKGDDAGESFQEMIRRLRRRYALHYTMPEARPGKKRTIKVELTRDAGLRYPRAKVRARTGYVVPGP